LQRSSELFNGETGKVIGIYGSDYLLVKFDTRFSKDLHKGELCEDPSASSYYMRPKFLSYADPKIQEELKKRREEIRLKHVEVDPFGEENWEE
jgi:hypothetical protein